MKTRQLQAFEARGSPSKRENPITYVVIGFLTFIPESFNLSSLLKFVVREGFVWSGSDLPPI